MVNEIIRTKQEIKYRKYVIKLICERWSVIRDFIILSFTLTELETPL